MRRKQTAAEIFWEVVPEIDQHEVRYREYIKKLPKEAKRMPVKKIPEPAIDCEIDDVGDEPDYASYIIPTVNPQIIHQEKKVTKQKQKLSFELIYSTLRAMKLTMIRKIIKGAKNELLELRKHAPSKNFLDQAQQVFNYMFNQEQQVSIYMCVRETLEYPPHLFKGLKSVYTVLAPEAAVIILRKKFKLGPRIDAYGILAHLEINDRSFYTNLSSKNTYYRR